MIFNELIAREYLPLYEVKELTIEEALLVIAAEKESGKSDKYSFKSECYDNSLSSVTIKAVA